MSRHKGQYYPGHAPWNKGMKGYDSGGRSHETRFQAGQKPWHTKNIGSTRINKDGQLERKVSNKGRKKWESVHRLVWKKHHGAIPKNHIVIFKKGCKTVEEDNITIDRLECISRAENMKRNGMWSKYPREVAETMHLTGVLNRKIRSKS